MGVGHPGHKDRVANYVLSDHEILMLAVDPINLLIGLRGAVTRTRLCPA